MRILAFDTGADFCAVVLTEHGVMVEQVVSHTIRDQAKILAPMTQDILKRHGLNAKDIDRFAIATGPGSFTGLRVGLAFAKGLELATRKPLYGFDHFQCLKQWAVNDGALAESDVLFVLESKRAELFACWMTGEKLGNYFLATAKNLIKALQERHGARLAGHGGAAMMAIEPSLTTYYADTACCAYAAAAAQLANQATSVSPATPLYLREADVSFPKSA